MWPPHTFSRARRSGPGLTLLCLAAACGFSGAAAGEARARKATGAPPSPVQLLAKVNKGIDRIVDKLSAVKSNMVRKPASGVCRISRVPARHYLPTRRRPHGWQSVTPVAPRAHAARTN